jgi:hypothetical protein
MKFFGRFRINNCIILFSRMICHVHGFKWLAATRVVKLTNFPEQPPTVTGSEYQLLKQQSDASAAQHSFSQLRSSHLN